MNPSFASPVIATFSFTVMPLVTLIKNVWTMPSWLLKPCRAAVAARPLKA
jgi:hypothetical protein